MSALDFFTLFVLLVIVVTTLFVFVFLGLWPGKIAQQRNHPQAEAITIGSWLGLIAGGVLWPLVLIWAYYNPKASMFQTRVVGEGNDLELVEKLQALEQRIAELEQQQSNAGGAA